MVDVANISAAAFIYASYGKWILSFTLSQMREILDFRSEKVET